MKRKGEFYPSWNPDRSIKWPWLTRGVHDWESPNGITIHYSDLEFGTYPNEQPYFQDDGAVIEGKGEEEEEEEDKEDKEDKEDEDYEQRMDEEFEVAQIAKKKTRKVHLVVKEGRGREEDVEMGGGEAKKNAKRAKGKGKEKDAGEEEGVMNKWRTRNKTKEVKEAAKKR